MGWRLFYLARNFKANLPEKVMFSNLNMCEVMQGLFPLPGTPPFSSCGQETNCEQG